MGKTEDIEIPTEKDGKHPHGRGEDRDNQQINRAETETPPRAWGRPDGLKGHVSTLRNTPTGVGKTKGPEKLNDRNWKHPHGRGEDLFFHD